MKQNICLFVLCCLLISCQSNTKQNATEVGSPPSASDTLQTPSDSSDKVLFGSGAKSFFSGINQQPDLFLIEAKGATWQEATILFVISTSGGQEIWRENLTGQDFLGSHDEDLSTPEKEAAHIEQRVKKMFDKENFKTPAIPADAVFEPDYSPDKLFWETLKTTKAPGFVYILGKGDGRYIGYDKKEQKVKLYYNCC